MSYLSDLFGCELKFGAMEQFRRDYNCFFTFSPPYTAVRNREAEWMNHVLCTMTLCMMVQAKVPAKFWGLCLIYAGEIWNVIPSEGKQSPIEVISHCNLMRFGVQKTRSLAHLNIELRLNKHMGVFVWHMR